MATLFYPTATSSSATSSDWTLSPTVRLLSLSRGAGVQTQTDNTVAALSTSGGGGAVLHAWGNASGQTMAASGVNWAAGTLLFVTNPLNAVTISSNPTWNSRGSESNAMANYSLGYQLYKLPSGGGTCTRFGGSVNGTEIGTTETVLTGALGSTSATIAAGDRIVFVLVFAGVGTSASGYTASGFYAGTTGGASGDTSISFVETITEQSAVARVPYSSPYPQLLAH